MKIKFPHHQDQTCHLKGSGPRAIPLKLIIGDANERVKKRSATQNECLYSSFLSQEEPKKVDDVLQDPDWIIAMQEELNQFE